MPSSELDRRVAELIRACRSGADPTAAAEATREAVQRRSGVETWSPDDDEGGAAAVGAIVDALLAGTLGPQEAAARLGSWAEVEVEAPAERYAPGERLGRGGTADVISAWDAQLERELALKVLRPPDPASRRRFVDEARTTAGLEHPGIVPVHDTGVTADGQPYFAMKRVRGRSLRELLEAGEAGPLRVRVDRFRRVCEAIGFAHARGVVHLDLKPDNVMVGEFGEVLVMDWGLARAPDRGPATRRGLSGTPAYMAPEQATGGPVDERTDVYALGALLYELLTGRPPFRGDGIDELLRAVVAGDLPPPRSVEPSIPAALDRLVTACLRSAPDARPDGVPAVLAALDAWLDDRPGPDAPPVERLVAWGRRNRGLVRGGVVVSVAVSLVLAGAFATWGRSAERARLRADEARASAEAAQKEARRQEGLANLSLAQAMRAQDELPAATQAYLAARDALLDAGADPLPTAIGLSEVAELEPFPVTLPLPGVPVEVSTDGARVVARYPDRFLVWTLPDLATPVRRDGRPGEVAVASGWLDGAAVRVWAAGDVLRVERDGAPDLSLPGGADRVVSLADGAIWVSNRPAGERGPALPLRRYTIDGRPAPVPELVPTPTAPLRVAPDGRWAWSDGTLDGRVLVALYDLETGRVRCVSALPQTGPECVEPARHLLLGPGGLQMVDGDVVDASGARRWTSPEDAFAVRAVSPDGRRIALSDYGAGLLLFEADSGRRVLHVPEDVHAGLVALGSGVVAWVPHGPVPVLRVRLGDGAGTSVLADQALPRSLAYTPDARLLLIGRAEDGLSLVHPESGRVLRRWALTGEVRGLEVHRDGLRVAWAAREQGGGWLDLRSGELHPAPLEGRALAATWSGDRLVLGTVDGRLVAYEGDPPVEVTRRDAHQGPIWAIDAATDGRILSGGLGGADGALRLWDRELSPLSAWVPDEASGLYGVALTPDGRRAAGGTNAGRVVRWDVDGTWVASEPDPGPVLDVDWLPRRGLVASVGYGRRLVLRDADTGAPVAALSLNRPGSVVELSADERWVAIGDGSGAVRWFDLERGARQQRGVAALIDPGSGSEQRLAALISLGAWGLAERVEGGEPWDRLAVLLHAGRDREARALAATLDDPSAAVVVAALDAGEAAEPAPGR